MIIQNPQIERDRVYDKNLQFFMRGDDLKSYAVIFTTRAWLECFVNRLQQFLERAKQEDKLDPPARERA